MGSAAYTSAWVSEPPSSHFGISRSSRSKERSSESGSTATNIAIAERSHVSEAMIAFSGGGSSSTNLKSAGNSPATGVVWATPPEKQVRLSTCPTISVTTPHAVWHWAHCSYNCSVSSEQRP